MTGRQVNDDEQTSTNIRPLSGIRTLGLSAQTIEAYAPESVDRQLIGVTIWRETPIADVCHCCREIVRNVLHCKHGMSTRKKFQTPFVRHISNYVRHAQFFLFSMSTNLGANSAERGLFSDAHNWLPA
jgi:hypothetical protein